MEVFQKSRTFNRAPLNWVMAFVQTRKLKGLEVRRFLPGHNDCVARGAVFGRRDAIASRQSNMNLNLERVSDEAQ
jgi:hypothetical protein